MEEGSGFKINRIEVKPGARLSLQSHKQRSEHRVVVKGEACIVNWETSATISTNQSTFIHAGNKRGLELPTENDLVIIEV